MEIEFEKEIEDLKKARRALSQEEDQDGNQGIGQRFLELDKKKFTFSKAPTSVQFVEASVVKEEIEEVQRWAAKHF